MPTSYVRCRTDNRIPTAYNRAEMTNSCPQPQRPAMFASQRLDPPKGHENGSIEQQAQASADATPAELGGEQRMVI